MSRLFITEFDRLAVGANGETMSVGRGPPVTDQSPVAISSTSTQSAAFKGTTHFVRLHTDAICGISFGADPTAVGTNLRLAANQTEYFGVHPGQKVAVISST